MAVKLSAVLKVLAQGGYQVQSQGDRVFVKRGGQPVATFFGSSKLQESQVRFIQDEVRKGTQRLASVQNGGVTRGPLVKAHAASSNTRPPSAATHRAMSGHGEVVHSSR